MIGRSALAAAVVLLGLCSVAGAAECKSTSQADLNQCAGNDYKRADAAMNTAYEALMGRIGPKAREGLKQAQRAWLPYRDRSCDLEALGTEGGSVQPMVRAGCLTQVTEQRTKMLEGYLTCEEGDLACVGRIAE